MKRETYQELALALSLPILACPYYQWLEKRYGYGSTIADVLSL